MSLIITYGTTYRYYFLRKCHYVHLNLKFANKVFTGLKGRIRIRILAKSFRIHIIGSRNVVSPCIRESITGLETEATDIAQKISQVRTGTILF